MDIRDQKPDADHRVKAEAALALRVDGVEYAVIASKLGYADESGPRKAVDRLLSRRESDSCDHYREIETSRLESLMAAHLPQARSGDIDATRAVLGIHDRLAKLHGLDRPRAVAVAVKRMTDVEFFNEAARLIAAIDALGGGDELRSKFPTVVDGKVIDARTDADRSRPLPPAPLSAQDDEPWSNIGGESYFDTNSPELESVYTGAEDGGQASDLSTRGEEIRQLLDQHLCAIREDTASELNRLAQLAADAETDAKSIAAERIELQKSFGHLS